jgi:hypothetical protein
MGAGDDIGDYISEGLSAQTHTEAEYNRDKTDVYTGNLEYWEFLKRWEPEKYKEKYPDKYAADVQAAKDAANNTANTSSTGGDDVSTDTNEESSEPSTIDYAELMRLQEKAAGRASAYNRNLAAELVGEVQGQTIGAAKALDESLRSEMDKLYPGMRASTAAYSQEALDATRKAAAEFSTGNVPQDVQDYQKRLSASLGISRGVFGTAPNYALAQNLGLNSLEMKKYGTQLYGTIPTMSSQVLANARTSMPAMNQLPQMYDAAYARAFAASAMPTGAFMGSIAQAMGQNANLAQDQSQFNTSLAWAKQLSEMQMAAEAARNKAQMDQYKDALKAQQQSNYWNLAGSAIGALGQYWGRTDNSTTNNNTYNMDTNTSQGAYNYGIKSFGGGYTGPYYQYSFGIPESLHTSSGWGSSLPSSTSRNASPTGSLFGGYTEPYLNSPTDEYGLTAEDYSNYGVGSSSWSGSYGGSGSDGWQDSGGYSWSW